MGPGARRPVAALAVVAAIAIIAGACDAARPTPSPTPPAAGTGDSADFRFAIDGEPTYFSPASDDQPTSWVNRLLYTGLYRVDNTGDVVPDLATAMPELGADGTTLTIKMRTDATWHDGSPVTAADAAFTFDLARSPACTFSRTTCSTFGAHVAAVETPAPDTVVVTLKDRYAPIYSSALTLGLVPKAATEASYARFVTGSSAVDPAAVTALVAAIAAAREDPACSGGTPPEPCSAAFHAADAEAVLVAAGIALPDRARYAGETGATDPAAYGDAVLGRLADLAAALQAGEADRLAAAYRLLDINLAPVGSGAYRFVVYVPGERVELARYDGYYRFRPGPARVVARVMKDPLTAAQALESGDLDWLPRVDTAEALAALRSDPGIRLSEYANLGYTFIGFNVRPGRPFADVVARRAFAMCIDHDAAVEAATGGSGVPVKGNVPPGSYFYDPSIPDYELDVAAARALLEDSGYTLRDGVYEKDGTRLVGDLYVRQNRSQRVAFAELAKEQVARCGIDLTVKAADYSTVLVPLLYDPNDFDLYLGGWGDLADPEDSRLFGCAHVTSKGNPYDDNFTGYCDPALDKLQAAAAREMDRGKRRELVAQVQQMLHDSGPYYFLWADLGHRGYRAAVGTNGELGPIDYGSPYDWWNIDSWTVSP
jgi:peptide/nickel transport system substrate-binding protein